MSPAKWNLPGYTEINQLQDTVTTLPPAGGAGNTVTVQQAGFVNKLRGWIDADMTTTVGAAIVKSTWGLPGGIIKRLQVLVAGRKPFFSMSGLGLGFYNEVNNPDGSVFAPPPYLAGAGDVVIAESTHLTNHTAGGGIGTFVLWSPFELLFGLPVWMTRLIKLGDDYIPVSCEEEVGLWYLQERKTSLTIQAEFHPPVSVVAGDPESPYSQVGAVGLYDAGSVINWERELFSVPPDITAWPDQGYVHQVIEYEAAIIGSTFSFPVPQVGALLRAIFIFHDNTDAKALQQWTNVENIWMSYGASDRPIDRPAWTLVNDYLHDYGRYPPSGVLVLDFYKAGRRAARLARDTDEVSNLVLGGNTVAGFAAGTVKIILESLVPQNVEVA